MDFNYNECIKEQNNIGETIYYNICDNQSYSVKWGSDDWIGYSFIFIIFIFFIILCIICIIEYLRGI